MSTYSNCRHIAHRLDRGGSERLSNRRTGSVTVSQNLEMPAHALILGCGRSGTSILGELFDSLPGVTYVSEPLLVDLPAITPEETLVVKVPNVGENDTPPAGLPAAPRRTTCTERYPRRWWSSGRFAIHSTRSVRCGWGSARSGATTHARLTGGTGSPVRSSSGRAPLGRDQRSRVRARARRRGAQRVRGHDRGSSVNGQPDGSLHRDRPDDRRHRADRVVAAGPGQEQQALRRGRRLAAALTRRPIPARRSLAREPLRKRGRCSAPDRVACRRAVRLRPPVAEPLNRLGPDNNALAHRPDSLPTAMNCGTTVRSDTAKGLASTPTSKWDANQTLPVPARHRGPRDI